MAPHPIGANAWIWVSPFTDERLLELALRLKAWGFDLLELPLEQVGDWRAGRAAVTLGALGLGATVCAAMGPGRELCATDAGTVAATQAYVRGCIDAAATVGSGVVAGPLYASVGRTWRMSASERRAVIGQLRESLATLCDYAAQRGVRLAVEPLVRYETSVINTIEQALEAIDGLPPEGRGILFDTYHANVEERDVAAALLAVGDRLVHLHASANDRGAPGADHLDWPGIRDALDAIAYAGPVVIESFTAENASIATAASIWRPLAASQDAIAVDGLAFLRSLLA